MWIINFLYKICTPKQLDPGYQFRQKVTHKFRHLAIAVAKQDLRPMKNTNSF
jgi:hypothetical protein